MSGSASEPVEQLPQRFDVWQADVRSLALPIPSEGGGQETAWMTVIASSTDDQIIAYELARTMPSAEVFWQMLAQAMQRPETSEPHKPTEIQICRPEWQAELRTYLDPHNIACNVVDELPDVDTVLEELSSHLATSESPGLLDMPGVTPEAAGSFFDAAALFYEQAPWTKTGERPIQVQAAKFESGPWFAVVIGQAGMSAGLILYDSLEGLRQAQRTDLSEEESARQTSALAVVFGPEDDLPPPDQDARRHHNWRVASDDAYPCVYRLEPGLNMRPPLAWELELLEGCLRAIPEFLRKKTRRLAPLEISVPVSGKEELTLVLSWEG